MKLFEQMLVKLLRTQKQKVCFMQTASHPSASLGDELISDVKGVAASAAERLHSEVDARKGDAVRQVQTVSSTFERTAEGLDSNAPAWIKSALEQGAQQVQKLADTLDQNDSRQMLQQMTDFANRSPGPFLGACAAVGFAAARIFKAGGNKNYSTQLDAVSPYQTTTGSSAYGSSGAADNIPGGLRGDLT